MSVLDRLASAMGRNDERPNVALAVDIAARQDAAAVDELVNAVLKGKKPAQHDAIKVLYEIGERRPELIAGHIEAFFTALKSGQNRLVWGGMSALDTITELKQGEIFARLPEIVEAAGQGSVIAMDKAVSILVKLAAAGHRARTVPTLLDFLRTSALNQLPAYAEQVAPLITRDEAEEFRSILKIRLTNIEQDSKRRRIEKVLNSFA